jgi:hypothetical protein
MLLYPNISFNSVKEININFIKENNIEALILDVDNTLIDYYRNLNEEVIKWSKDIKAEGIKLYILSNTNKKDKVEAVSQKLDIPYINFARKPSKKGFLKVQKILDVSPEKIGVVGDQIFTDVIGGNRCKMFTILVEPIDKKDIWITMLKRPLENFVKKCYRKSLSKKTKEEIKENVN